MTPDELQDWIARADRLAAVFAAGAARHDRDGTFPDAHAAAARDDGWPALAVPAELGGAGAGLHDVCLLEERLGRGDTSSALGLGMHHIVMGSHAGPDGGWPAAAYAGLCRAAVDSGALCNSLASEPEQGSPSRGGLPRTAARPHPDGGFIVDGRKTWSTWLPALTHATIAARVDAEEGPRVATLLVDLSLPGVTRDAAFPAVALRASASGTLALDGVHVPPASLLGLHEPGERAAGAVGMGAWFQLVTSAVYTGTAHAARDAVARFCRERRPNDRSDAIAALPSVQVRLGRVDAAVRSARLTVLAAARAWDAAGPELRLALMPDIGIAKVTATNLAAQAVEEAMRLAGGPGLLVGELPLERHWRDVRGGLVHPPLDDILYQQLGRGLAEGGGGDGEALV